MKNGKNYGSETAEAWSREYKRQGIPSSFQSTPTRVLQEFVIWLKGIGYQGEKAADLGCGKGRNSNFLANQGYTVFAIDLLPENRDAVQSAANIQKLPIVAHSQDLSDAWPILSNDLDIAIDIFCYKHITNKVAQKRYRQELWRTLKPEGYYFLSLASVDDGFYGPLLRESPAPVEKMIIDPIAGIASYLYSLEDLSSEFSDLFRVADAWESTSRSMMHGNEYERRVLNVILKKRENVFSFYLDRGEDRKSQ